MNCCIVKSPRHHSPAVSQFFLDMLLIWCTAFCRLCIVWLQWDGAFSFRRAFDWTKISVVKDESSIFKCIFLLKVNLSPFSLNCLISKLTRIDKSSHFDFFDIMVLCELQLIHRVCPWMNRMSSTILNTITIPMLCFFTPTVSFPSPLFPLWIIASNRKR